MKNDNEFIKIASYQGPIQEREPEANLEKTLRIMQQADSDNVDILCMPESYLHGYFEDVNDAKQYSFDLQSTAFARLCEPFKDFKTTLILGLNERCGDEIYNTAVVIEEGAYLGCYRKAYTYAPYDYFSLGREFPVFTKKGINYSIIICLDSAYREPAFISALKGARILFCPMFNRVPKDAKMLNYLHRKSHFITRAFDNHCWLISSDIVWDEGDKACPGYATIVNSDGLIVAQAQPFTEMLLSYNIPIKDLQQIKKQRLYGDSGLFKMVVEAYRKGDSCI